MSNIGIRVDNLGNKYILGHATLQWAAKYVD